MTVSPNETAAVAAQHDQQFYSKQPAHEAVTRTRSMLVPSVSHSVCYDVLGWLGLSFACVDSTSNRIVLMAQSIALWQCV